MRRHGNLLATMLLGGLWHGAGWTFVFWGGLHGVYLVLNHFWRYLMASRRGAVHESTPVGRFIARVITFLSVVFAWVFFRAVDFDSAVHIAASMSGLHGFDWSAGWDAWTTNIHGAEAFMRRRFPELLLIVWLMPNTWQLLKRYEPALDGFTTTEGGIPIKWSPGRMWGVVVGAMLAYSVLNLTAASEFLYFQF